MALTEAGLLDLEREAVVRYGDSVRRRQLDGAMREKDPAVRRLECLFCGQVSSQLAVGRSISEGGLADEQVGATRKRRELGGRRRIARVREHASAFMITDAEAERLHRVVRKLDRLDGEPSSLERLARRVLPQHEGTLPHPRYAPERGEGFELLSASGRQPELGTVLPGLRAVGVQPRPGNQVSAVVEMPVGYGDRIRHDLLFAQASQDAWAAVDEELPGTVDEVAGLCAARVRPGRRRADDGQPHLHILADVARKIRVVIAKPGVDGHDRGAKIIARALRDAGMEVIYTGLHQTPEQIVETAIQEDADAVGISILSGAHMTLVPRILEGLKENGAEDVLVVLGGTIPDEDAEELKAQGVAEVFTPGAPTSEIVDFLKEKVPV